MLEEADVAVPVPLHWRRRVARGFNQAEDLASHLGLPVCGPLRRGRATRAQFGLQAAARQRNVRGAFRASLWVRLQQVVGPALGAGRIRPPRRGGPTLEGKCVVLVDDLATTGATLRECAVVLKRLGAREVRALTAARALSRQP